MPESPDTFLEDRVEQTELFSDEFLKVVFGIFLAAIAGEISIGLSESVPALEVLLAVLITVGATNLTLISAPVFSNPDRVIQVIEGKPEDRP